jgi:hypothetical protein
VNPCRAVAKVLEPVPVAGLRPEEATRLRDEVRARIQAALPRATHSGAAEPSAAPHAGNVGAVPPTDRE